MLSKKQSLLNCCQEPNLLDAGREGAKPSAGFLFQALLGVWHGLPGTREVKEHGVCDVEETKAIHASISLDERRQALNTQLRNTCFLIRLHQM